ncbi:MAG: hypothetical protein ACOZCP_19285 [Pseudomonadota bacterium]|jgi:hypothetical protein
MRTATKAAQVARLPLQMDLFAGLEEAAATTAEVLPFPKTSAAAAVEATIKRRNARNFVIGNELADIGDPERKFADNVAAIRLLQKLSEEGRPATEKEKRVLVRYTGWGGLPQAFDMTDSCAKPHWREEFKALLSREDWEAARASVNNAHYTDPVVVRFIWATLKRIGFAGGRIIEPAAGIGHFLGCMPQDIAAVSDLHAVEIDRISAQILRTLYPDAVVHARGFEKVAFPSGSFDLAISNVPFGKYRLSDPKYDRLKLSVHDYFFAKSLDLVRPGGIVAFVTSHFTVNGGGEGTWPSPPFFSSCAVANGTQATPASSSRLG